MIGKVVVGRDFAQVLRYVEGKEGAYLIDSNMAGRNRSELVAEFSAASARRPGVSRCVWHTTLSVRPEENLSDATWTVVARDYLEQVGLGGRQYLAYRHGDTEHHHIHIIANRIGVVDGSLTSDSWNWRQTEVALRDIEERYDLHRVESPRRQDIASPTTGEIRQQRRTGKPIVRSVLQARIHAALDGCEGEEDFGRRLKRQGISVRFRRQGGKIVGISFALNGIAFQGSQLGRMFSWNGIARALERNRDNGILKQRYRRRYQRLREALLSHVGGERIDEAIALVLLKGGSKVQEVEAILSQGDAVRTMMDRRGDKASARTYIQTAVRSAQLALEGREHCR
jgi:hypothetical protein